MAQLFDTRLLSILVGGEIEPGAKLYWYTAETTTATDTYTDPTLSTANANPVIADGNGRFPSIWLAVGSYKYILTASDGSPSSPLITQDKLTISAATPSFASALSDFLAGTSPLPIANGGTNATTASDAADNLGALKKSGGTMTGNILRSGHGGHLYFATSAMTSSLVYLTSDASSDPRSGNPGEIWLTYAA